MSRNGSFHHRAQTDARHARTHRGQPVTLPPAPPVGVTLPPINMGRTKPDLGDFYFASKARAFRVRHFGEDPA